jgi:hypothetical protein
MDLQIDGLGTVPNQNIEYTSGQMLADYLTAMRLLQSVLDQTQSNSSTSTEIASLLAGVNQLKSLATKGDTSGTGSTALTYYMTSDMLTNTAAVFKSLTAAGIDINDPSTVNVDSIANWQGLGSIGVDSIMNLAVSVSTSATRTLQSMVELEFVQAGNEQIALQMQTLATALQVAQNALDTLQLISGISNEITVGANGSFAFPPLNLYAIPSTAVAALRSYFNSIANKTDYTGDDFFNAYNIDVSAAKTAIINNPSLTWSAACSEQILAATRVGIIISSLNSSDPTVTENVYRILASAHFSQINPQAAPTSTAATDLLAAKGQLLDEIQTMENNNIAYASSVNSLPYFMKQVATDISTYFANINPTTMTGTALTAALKTAVTNWIMDNQDQKISTSSAGTAGAIQSRISQAITAAQSLNDTEKANVQTAEYNFQQFYQSASTVLQKITQIIEAAAQGISH